LQLDKNEPRQADLDRPDYEARTECPKM